jgi:hypothetical protein
MDARSSFRRAILVALAALVLVGSTVLGGDTALAASKKKNSKNNDEKTAEVVFSGYLKRQSNCEGKLEVWVYYDVDNGGKGSKVGWVSTKVDADGHWSIEVDKISKGDLTAKAILLGHVEQGLLSWEQRSASTKSDKKIQVDFDYLRIEPC